MKKHDHKFVIVKSRSSIIILCLLALLGSLSSWGTFGHEHINHAAVIALPESSLQRFFFNHVDFITQESTVPDLRKYTLNDKEEKPRHYIDLENYGSLDSLPLTLEDAKKKYDEKFLAQNGTLPWHLQEMVQKLTKAFKEKRKTEILFLAADIGHYVGDANMPLHTSVNHDGQLTDQRGIHAFWETQLPELFGEKYTYRTKEVKYINHVQKEIFEIIFSSHLLVDTLLLADKKLKETFENNKIYQLDENGKTKKNKFNQPVHSLEYANKYNELLKGMVEKQMNKSINSTASLWYTAWVNAGKPELDNLDPSEITQQNAKQLKKEINFLKNGKLVVINSEKEF